MNTSFKPGKVWCDNNNIPINAHGAGMLVHRGKYYWYGEHKIDGDYGNQAWVGVHAYSSDDLYNWTDEGIAFSIADNLNEDIFPTCIIERPKVLFCEKTGKFVMWFHYDIRGSELKGTKLPGSYGVAVSDNPVKDFKLLYIGRVNKGHWPVNADDSLKDPQLIEKTKEVYSELRYDANEATPEYSVLGMDIENGQQSRDMTLFLDDDGKAYHIYSSEKNSTTHIARLSDDFTGHTGEYYRVFPNRWMEAPCIFKRDGKYYFIASDCTSWAPNAARSAVAEHIYGPWTELGNPAGDHDLAETTFESQSTYVLQVEDEYIYLGDRWRPQNAIDGRYVWLPLTFQDEKPVLEWHDEWRLS
jgi:hypothetical protein